MVLSDSSKFKIELKAIQQPAKLETSRLELLPVTDDFRPFIMQYLSDKQVRHQMKMEVMDTPAKQEQWWQRFKKWRAENQAVQWCGFEKETGEYIALLTLKEIDLQNCRAEIGYSVLKEFWGQGYGKESALAVASYGFEEINLHTIFAIILPQNEGSKRIIHSLKFKKEAELKDVHYYRGQFYTALQFSKINPSHLRS